MSTDDHKQSGIRNIRFAFFLNLGFSLIEFVGGLLTNSIAILSDALHDLGDSISLGLSWWAEKYSTRKRDYRYTFGYRRFALLGALVNIIVLLSGSLFIIVESIGRLAHPEEVKVKGMLLLAVLGILVNGLAVYRLSRKGGITEKTVSLHMLEDLLGWVAVLAGAGLIHFTGWLFIDPLLSLSIAVWILTRTTRHMRSILSVFMQAVPEGFDLNVLAESIRQEPKIKEVHDLHLWTIDGEKNILSCHVVVDENTSLQEADRLRKQVKRKLSKKNITHSTIEIENLGSCAGFQH